MLLSYLLSLRATAPAPILGPLGRPASAWFLHQVTQVNPTKGQQLHDGNGVRPYTVSTLLDARGRPLPAGSWLEKGDECWLRITTCERELSDLLLNRILTERNPKLSRQMTMYKMPFCLDGWTLDPAQHPWAGQMSFDRMAQDPTQPLRSRQVCLEFATPTAFRSGDADQPLPVPAQVFRSYWEKWNAFAPEPYQIQDVWRDFVQDCVVVSELVGVNSERWEFAEGSRGVATGFTGTVSFALLPKHQCGSWAEVWDGADRVLQSLAQFAFYCGTGHHATIGMGQTRPIHLNRTGRGETG
jgi:CRISPR-associated endoribonuclease Cas6